MNLINISVTSAHIGILMFGNTINVCLFPFGALYIYIYIYRYIMPLENIDVFLVFHNSGGGDNTATHIKPYEQPR